MRSSTPPEIAAPEVTLRIPGGCSRPAEFCDRLSCDCRADVVRRPMATPVNRRGAELTRRQLGDECPGVLSNGCRISPGVSHTYVFPTPFRYGSEFVAWPTDSPQKGRFCRQTAANLLTLAHPPTRLDGVGLGEDFMPFRETGRAVCGPCDTPRKCADDGSGRDDFLSDGRQLAPSSRPITVVAPTRGNWCCVV
jgi:hypothetical protein